ncbi:MAG: RNA 2',3'-cyclic phosphodiesterase [Thermoplasmata archaeon]|jgi:2'-5' RNA ligase|nr:RNA 2',3'-cyclic phosphodiesterase [Thermoplasmatales archaeon]
MRLFTGIKINAGDEIIEMQRYFKNRYRMKAVEVENMHITLKFIGEVDDREVEKIDSILSGIYFNGFNIKLRGAGAFPDERRARVIWIGIISDDLLKLGREVSEKLSMYNDEKFSPHLTIGRLKDITNISEDLKKYRERDFGEFYVDHFSLYKSTLTPNGPVYDEIKKYFSRD